MCSGYAANPMVQPLASKLALSSIAGYLRGEDPEAVWSTEVGPLRTFAEACDGERPRLLVGAALAPDPSPDALDALDDWLGQAAACTARGLDDDVVPWLDQVHAEADLGLRAVRLLRARRADAEAPIGEAAIAVALMWRAARRARVTVMGPRCSIRPMIWHDPDGNWRWDPASVDTDDNAVDALVRHALGLAPSGL